MFNSGDKVKDRYGHVWTVLLQCGVQVFVEEDVLVWFHPANLARRAK